MNFGLILTPSPHHLGAMKVTYGFLQLKMDLNQPILFNVTLRQVRNFQYLDQGILRLSKEKGLSSIELDLSELGAFKAMAGQTKLGFCDGRALCALNLQEEGPGLDQFQAVISEIDDALCLSGLGLLKTENRLGKRVVKSCFVVGYAISG